MLTVFVVDDDAAICESLDLLLTGEGYHVVCAEDGTRAVNLLREHTETAVVLFDYLMPHGDGLYLLSAVATDESLQRRFAYVCMAARPRSRLPNAFNELLDQLDVPFVDKPFDVDNLLRAVDEAYRGLVARIDTGRHGGDFSAP